ncbi:MAG: sigma-70 family RNA polymerase sigma factor [Planctomycetota bacterium]
MSGPPDPISDDARLAEWWADHASEMRAFAARRIGEQAEDVVQDVFVAAANELQKNGAPDHARGFLFTILRRRVVDHLRSVGRARDHEAKIADALKEPTPFRDGIWAGPVMPWRADPAQVAESTEFWAALQSAVDGLPEPMRQVFVFREFDKLPTAEVCDLLGITQGNLWTLLHRARLRLREQLGTFFTDTQ